jgi:hypothetical protein
MPVLREISRVWVSEGGLEHGNRENLPGPGKKLHAPYTQAVDDDLLVIENSWPGTTIDGDPGIVSGMLSVSRAAGGEFLLNLSVGPAGGAPEDFTYLEFSLSPDDAAALRDALR